MANNNNKLIWFDAEGYKSAIRAELKDAMSDIRREIVQELKKSAASLPFKNNEVKLAGGVVTSDLKRKQAVMDAINSGLEKVETDIYNVTFTALARDFKDAHIGIYYEHGTGNEWDGKFQSITDAPFTVDEWSPNPHRDGRTIVSRSKHIDYSGHGKGVWIDLGGNVRKTGSRRAGVRDDNFVKYIGEDTKAYHWYSNAFKNKYSWIINRLRTAIHNVQVSNYLRCKATYILGKDEVD